MIAGGIERIAISSIATTPTRTARSSSSLSEMPSASVFRGQSYEPHYEGSSVVVGPPAATCSLHGKYAFEALAGLTWRKTLSAVSTSSRSVGDGFRMLRSTPLMPWGLMNTRPFLTCR